MFASGVGEWTEDAERIATAGYRQVLDVCDSESETEYSDHGAKWSDSEMYTPDIMDEKGKPVLGRARMTTEGRSGSLVTVRAPG
jgi:hypothetical protein